MEKDVVEKGNYTITYMLDGDISKTEGRVQCQLCMALASISQIFKTIYENLCLKVEILYTVQERNESVRYIIAIQNDSFHGGVGFKLNT